MSAYLIFPPLFSPSRRVSLFVIMYIRGGKGTVQVIRAEGGRRGPLLRSTGVVI